ncbi:MAG: hypothetical protein QXS91_01020 [Candidatus Anstonellales archaeon]
MQAGEINRRSFGSDFSNRGGQNEGGNFNDIKNLIKDYIENGDEKILSELIEKIKRLETWNTSKGKTIMIHTMVSKWKKIYDSKDKLDSKKMLIDAGKISYIAAKNMKKGNPEFESLSIVANILSEIAKNNEKNDRAKVQRGIDALYITTLYLQTKANTRGR